MSAYNGVDGSFPAFQCHESRRCIAATHESANGPKRTSLVAPHMPAFVVAIGSKTDMTFCSANVRFCPETDIAGLAYDNSRKYLATAKVRGDG
jgi:hypothetical protein